MMDRFNFGFFNFGFLFFLGDVGSVKILYDSGISSSMVLP
jgi:hypothetical protein